MPTFDTGNTDHITVRHSPIQHGHLELNVNNVVSIRLNRNDAMILGAYLDEIAFQLPLLATDKVVGR